jgi:hypothetical protein
LGNFIDTIHNYDFYELNLNGEFLLNVIKLYKYVKDYEKDKAKEIYNKITDLIDEYELNGTDDLCNPIYNIK